LLALALGHVPAKAEDSQVKRGPTPDWVVPSELMPVPEGASGMLFVRRQDIVAHLDDQGQAQYLGYRMRLLHPNALQLGNISIAWNPASGPPVVHMINVYRDGQKIDVLKNASFEILRREDQLEAAMLDGVLTAVLRVPDLRVGDELEVGLTTRSNDPTLAKNDSGVLFLLPSPQPGRFHLGLSWDEGQKPNVRMTPDMAAVARTGDRSIDFLFDNPGISTPPKDAPTRYQWQRLVEYSDFADWAAVSRHFAPLFAKAAQIPDGSPLEAEARRIAAAYTHPLDRAAAALKLVQRDVRYIYVGLGSGNLTPATAEETWQRRYGDCKGKTALLLGLLAKLGIEAEAVIANNQGNDDGLDERLPNPGLFDHVLVRARIDGTQYWLDGTLPPVATPATDPAIDYEWVLPLSEQGSPLEKRKWRPADRPDEITLYEIDARAGFDQPARVTNTTITRGIAGLQQQAQMSGLSADQLLGALRQNIVGNTWQTVDEAKWHYDQKARASILTIIGTWEVDWDNDGGGARSLALPGGGFNPPEKRIRPPEQNQDLPFYNKPEFDCRVTTVRFPSTTKAANWTFKSGFDTHIFGKNYYRAFDVRDGSIRMIRGLRVDSQEIEAARARRDNGRIEAFDNSKGWIFYNPLGGASPSAARKVVPATYDIDWTADNVPCLSSAAVSRVAAR
jgi:transglutaminase-like putative cysteine protease